MPLARPCDRTTKMGQPSLRKGLLLPLRLHHRPNPAVRRPKPVRPKPIAQPISGLDQRGSPIKRPIRHPIRRRIVRISLIRRIMHRKRPILNRPTRPINGPLHRI